MGGCLHPSRPEPGDPLASTRGQGSLSLPFSLGEIMAQQFEWKDAYRVGIEDIDEEHRELVRIANRLFGELDNGQLQRELMTLRQHMLAHFHKEEILMGRIGYPRLAEHRTLHEALLDDFDHYAANVARNPEQVPGLRAFLVEWVLDHIVNHDQGIAEFQGSLGRDL
jgi:hemerythrin